MKTYRRKEGQKDGRTDPILQDPSGRGRAEGCKRRHDKVCLNIDWALSKKYGVKVCERWYEHKVESVIENDIVKIL